MLRAVGRTLKANTLSVGSWKSSIRSATSIVNRGEDRSGKSFEEGEICHGFKVFEKFEVPDKKWMCYRLSHEKTNAEYLHIDCADMENTFGIVLKTLPQNSTGIAHILEHTTLCGSKKYPVRDPFFNMLKRSVNTYMNAWTGYDWTAYPFSSQNKKDFRNLLEVYTDAVFFPNLNRLDFLQEGHRLELTNPEDINSPVTIKGVVYNEMKGANSSQDSQIMNTLSANLFPSNVTYHHDSGGDISEIPKLTYEDLKQFHKENYHPSNTRFYSYGDLPLEDHLEFLDNNVLNSFEKSSSAPDIPKVNRFNSVSEVDCKIAPFPGIPLELGNTALISYLTNDITNLEEVFTLEILSSLLLKGNSSPFYKARMDRNGLGNDYSVATGYSDATKETTFGFGLQGVTEEQIPQVFDMIQSTLEDVAKEGFSKERIDSVLHGAEIQKKSIPGNFGLSTFGMIVSHWIHGTNIQSIMDMNTLIGNFKTKLDNDPKLLQKKIEEHLLENTHGVKLTCRPDPEYSQKIDKEESVFISNVESKLTKEDRERILKEQIELEKYQAQEQDRELLPKVHLNDISKSIEKNELSFKDINGYHTQWNAQILNELSYIRGFASITDMPRELTPYVPLFCTVFGGMATEKYSYMDLSQRIQNYTGGVSCNWSIHHNYGLPSNQATEWGINFSSLALERNIPHMFDLLSDIFLLKPQGIEQLKSRIQRFIAGKGESLMNSGHQFAMAHSSRNISAIHKANEELSGVSYLKFLQSIKDDDFDSILQKIIQIGEYLQTKSNIRFAVNADEQLFGNIENGIHSFTSKITKDNENQVQNNSNDFIEDNERKVFVPLQSSVNYCSMSFPGVNYEHEDYAKLKVLSTVVSYNYLHPEIREKGGAYGGGLKSGDSISFYSYRDPNIEATLNTFSNTVNWIKDGKGYNDTDIEEAKISILGGLDSPIVPSKKGTAFFSQGITDEMRQKLRDGVFSTSKDDLINISEKYIGDSSKSYITVVGNQDKCPSDWNTFTF